MLLCFPEMGLEKIKFNRTNLEKHQIQHSWKNKKLTVFYLVKQLVLEGAGKNT